MSCVWVPVKAGRSVGAPWAGVTGSSEEPNLALLEEQQALLIDELPLWPHETPWWGRGEEGEERTGQWRNELILTRLSRLLSKSYDFFMLADWGTNSALFFTFNCRTSATQICINCCSFEYIIISECCFSWRRIGTLYYMKVQLFFLCQLSREERLTFVCQCVQLYSYFLISKLNLKRSEWEAQSWAVFL